MKLPENDDQLLLLHNSRCSKSRAVLAILEASGVPFAQRNYLDEPLTRPELADLQGRLGKGVLEWTRTGETAFAESGLSRESEEAELMDAMAKAPILMERPIVVRGRRAVVGRPPEVVKDLL